jgi:hypothetical protein
MARTIAEDINGSNNCSTPARRFSLRWGLSLVGIGWLGYSLLAFLALIDIVAPLSAWAWSTFVR